jgi:hypothetical protein
MNTLTELIEHVRNQSNLLTSISGDELLKQLIRINQNQQSAGNITIDDLAAAAQYGMNYALYSQHENVVPSGNTLQWYSSTKAKPSDQCSTSNP